MNKEIDDWEKEWDRIPHTISEYQSEIKELRERILNYVQDIEIRDQLIAELRDELTLLNKYWRKENLRE